MQTHVRYFTGALIAFFIFPLITFAHVKWFAPKERPDVEPYHLTDWPVLLWIAASLVIIYIGILIERHGPRIHGKFAHVLHKCEAMGLTLFSIACGGGLLYYATQGYVFAPNLIPESTFGSLLLITESIVGLSLILGIFVRVSGLLLFTLYIATTLHFGVIEMIDALEIVGISFFLIVVGRPRLRISKWKWIDTWARPYRDYAIPTLRIFTGLNLIALGFSEKILAPDLGMAFLSIYDWNFMQILGFSWFSDYWFVFSAGIVEILLGVVFVLGVVTRINTLVLSFFFAATLILLGPAEVIGHILHFAIVAMLLVFGAGKKLRIVPQ